MTYEGSAHGIDKRALNRAVTDERETRRREQMRDLAVCFLSGGFGAFILFAAYLIGGGK